MAELDATAMSAALKEYYDEGKLTDLVALQSPLLGMMPKGKFIGKNVPYPMVTNPGQAAMSGTYSTANTNRAPAGFDRFVMTTPGRIFAIGGIERDIIDLAQTPKGAFDDINAEVEAKLDFVARELAHTCQRSENGLCGKIASITEGGGQTTIVVEDFADVANLGAGANLVASATAAGALHAATTYPVVSVVHSTGTIVLTGTAATTSSWAVGSFLHRDGSATAGGTAKYPSGLLDWIPDTAPTSGDSWRGVDRSVAPDKLAGIRVDASASQVREAASEMAARIIANGGMPDRLVVHPIRYSILEQELDSLATHEKVPARNTTAQIGYNGLRIAAGNGSVVIVSDPFCPYYRGYMLTMRTWKFLEIGGKRQPRLRDMGGGRFLQMEDADAVKFQCEAKGDLACSNPGANGVIKFN
ncbi:MAG: hypothetical protein RLP09_09605 [Sandaracinaceae bacterium]